MDARSDQFAFGAVVYEMITGRRAFERDTAIETISSVLSSEPRPIASLQPRLLARLAGFYAATQAAAKARGALREALAGVPQDPDVWAQAAVAYASLGDHLRAVDCLEPP